MTQQDVASATIAGLKEAGIDFVASVPSTVFSMVIPVVSDDPDFVHVEVAGEGDGIGVCAGARLGGKRPTLLAENSGLLVASYALRALENFGGVPMLLLLDHRGVFGEGDGYWYFSTGESAVPLLQTLHIPFTIVDDTADVTQAIIDGSKTVEASRRPAAVLLGARVK